MRWMYAQWWLSIAVLANALVKGNGDTETDADREKFSIRSRASRQSEFVDGSLDSRKKDRILGLHNEYRSAVGGANVREMVRRLTDDNVNGSSTLQSNFLNRVKWSVLFNW